MLLTSSKTCWMNFRNLLSNKQAQLEIKVSEIVGGEIKAYKMINLS